MTDNEPDFDSSDPLKSALDRVTAARANLLETLNTYDTTGQELTKTALERLQRLNDPPVNPVRTDAIAGLTSQLSRFDHPWIPLAGSVGLLLLALVSALESQALRMMTIPPSESTADTGGRDPIADAAAKALAFIDRVHAAVQRNKIIMTNAADVANTVAETVEEVVGLLTARFNLLAAFVRRTDPTPENADVPSSRFRRILRKIFPRFFTEAAIKETALQVTAEFLKALVKEAPKLVPVAGIPVSIIVITQEVREKQKALRERRELLQKVAAAYYEPNVLEAMLILLGQFKQDDTTITEFSQLVDDLTKRLESGLAG
jgi:hypothetical protein